MSDNNSALEDWLGSAGMASHAASFREQAITLEQLADLTEVDLRELGLNIGDRKRLRAALKDRATLNSSTPTLPERRPMTVVFVDLVESTSLGERLDPEDLLSVLRAYRAFCAESIERFGGTVARFFGDGILVYFCYPIAHENDPERAVRASLAITAGIGRLETQAPSPLRVRIGIATGLVVISDIKEGALDLGSIVGSTPNLAARLQSLASPDGIVLSDATYKRIMDRFECVPLGDTELRGFAGLHRPWSVTKERLRNSRTPPIPPRLTAFHGRQSEIAQVEQAWQRTRSGMGGAILVLAEAGYGKSRLIEHVIQTYIRDGSVLHIAAAPLDQDIPLHPFRADLRANASLEESDDVDAAMLKLESTLPEDTPDRSEVLSILASLLGLPVTDAVVRSMKPETLRARTIAAVAGQMLALADHGPACLVLEDLHWLDPTSLEVLATVIVSLRTRPLLVLMTARERFVSNWSGDAGVTALRLPRLSTAEVYAMLDEIFAHRPIFDQSAENLTLKSGGVPLYVEEVARGLLQRDPMNADQTSDPAMIPATLHESLVAHLDRTGPAKELAQLAAVIGLVARVDVLRAAYAKSGTDDLLVTLIEEGVLLPAPDNSLTFAHALMRDAAYDGLLKEGRTALHNQVAVALERLRPSIARDEPDALAVHLAAAGQFDRAADLWVEAARRALQRAALTEAGELLQRGLTPLEALPPAPDRLERRLRIMALLGPVLIGIKGSKSPQAQALYARAVELAALLPASPSHFPISWGWWRVSPDFHAHLGRSKTLLARANREADPGQLLQAHHCCWASHYHAGDFSRCAEHLVAGLAIYGSGDYSHHARLYGNHDAKACAHGEFARMLWMQGSLLQAAQHERLSLGWARGLDHLGSLVHALDSALFVRVYRRDLASVRVIGNELIKLTSEHDIADHGASGHIFRGWVATLSGNPAAGRQLVEEQLGKYRTIATYEDFPVYACIFAETLIADGKPERAAEELARERGEFERIGLSVWRPEVLRMQAVAAQAMGKAEEAYSFLTEADAVAVQQATPMLRLRIATTLAGLPDSVRSPAMAGAALNDAISAVTEPDHSVDFLSVRKALAVL